MKLFLPRPPLPTEFLLDAVANDDVSVSPGSRGYVSRLQELLQRLSDYPHCLPTTNGTAAIAVAAKVEAQRAREEGRAPEVVLPPYTWWPAVTAFFEEGFRVRIAAYRVGRRTAHAEELLEALGEETTTVYGCHLWGDTVDLASVAVEVPPAVRIVEDACHTSLVEGAYPAIGDYVVHSFHRQKPIAAGEGGALLLRCRATWKRAVEVGHWEYVEEAYGEQSSRGQKYRMSALNAAVACEVLEQFSSQQERLRETCSAFVERASEALESSHPWIRCAHTTGHCLPNDLEGTASHRAFLHALHEAGIPLYGNPYRSPARWLSERYGLSVSACERIQAAHEEADRQRWFPPVSPLAGEQAVEQFFRHVEKGGRS